MFYMAHSKRDVEDEMKKLLLHDAEPFTKETLDTFPRLKLASILCNDEQCLRLGYDLCQRVYDEVLKKILYEEDYHVLMSEALDYNQKIILKHVKGGGEYYEEDRAYRIICSSLHRVDVLYNLVLGIVLDKLQSEGITHKNLEDEHGQKTVATVTKMLKTICPWMEDGDKEKNNKLVLKDVKTLLKL